MATEERKVDVVGANASAAPPWAGNAEEIAAAALKEKQEQHIEGSVKPQLTELEKAVQKKLVEQAARNEEEQEAMDNAARQKAADEKILTGDEANGIPHMDLLRASMHVDGQIDIEGVERGEQGETLADRPNAHAPQPFITEQSKPNVKWKPGQ